MVGDVLRRDLALLERAQPGEPVQQPVVRLGRYPQLHPGAFAPFAVPVGGLVTDVAADALGRRTGLGQGSRYVRGLDGQRRRTDDLRRGDRCGLPAAAAARTGLPVGRPRGARRLGSDHALLTPRRPRAAPRAPRVAPLRARLLGAALPGRPAPGDPEGRHEQRRRGRPPRPVRPDRCAHVPYPRSGMPLLPLRRGGGAVGCRPCVAMRSRSGLRTDSERVGA